MGKKTPATNPGKNDDLNSGKIIPNGVGLTEGEVAAVDSIAAEHGLTRNALLRFAVRTFILNYRSGNIDLENYIFTPPPPKRKLELPE